MERNMSLVIRAWYLEFLSHLSNAGVRINFVSRVVINYSLVPVDSVLSIYALGYPLLPGSFHSMRSSVYYCVDSSTHQA